MKPMLKDIKFKKFCLTISWIFFIILVLLSILLPIYFYTDFFNAISFQSVTANETYELFSATSGPIESTSNGLEWWQILAIVLSIVIAIIIFLVLFLIIKLFEKKYDDVDKDDETTFFSTDGIPPSTR